MWETCMHRLKLTTKCTLRCPYTYLAWSFCLFVLWFYGPVNNEVMSSRSVNSGTVPWQGVYLFGSHFGLCRSLNRLPVWNSQNCSMFPLAFVARWLQGHWWGFISRNYVVWPTFFLMNVFIALKGSHFWFYIRPSKRLTSTKRGRPRQ